MAAIFRNIVCILEMSSSSECLIENGMTFVTMYTYFVDPNVSVAGMIGFLSFTETTSSTSGATPEL